MEDEVPEVICGDVGRLRQVIINLVGNAIKFTDQGEVAVIVRKVWVRDGKACLRFSVADTGMGIPPDKQAMIFQEFTQADYSPTRRHGGTGPGLAITLRLVGLMGGEVSVESPSRRIQEVVGGNSAGYVGSTFDFEIVAPVGSDERTSRSS